MTLNARPIKAAAIGVLSLVGLAIAACGAKDSDSWSSPETSAAERSSSAAIVDPLDVITDPASSDFVAESVVPVLHESGTGASEFTVRQGQLKGGQITFYVSCDPESSFTVRAFDNHYSGVCSRRFSSSGTFPVASSASEDSPIELDLPDSTAYILLAITQP